MVVEYLSISEFAENAGVSKQAIYKQIGNKNSQITPYVLKEGRKTLIKASALKELYGVETTKTTFSTNQEGENAAIATPSDAVEVDFATHEEEVSSFREQPLNPFSTKETQPLSTDYIEFLKAQIAELKEEKADIEKRLSAAIQDKERIIQDQSAQLADLAQKVAQIADKALIATSQQQYLTALEKKGEREETAVEEQYPNVPKKTFLQRLFGK